MSHKGARKVSKHKGGGRRSGIGSSSIKQAHSKRKLNNNRLISAMRKSR